MRSILCLAMFGHIACEKRATTLATPTVKQDAPTTQEVKQLALSLDVSRAQMPNLIDAPWVPDPEAVRGDVGAIFSTSSAITLEGGDLDAKLEYGAMRIALPQQPEKLAVAASFAIATAPARWQDARIERIVMVDEMPTDDTKKSALLRDLIADLAQGIIARHELAMIPDEGLVKALEARDVITIEQAHDALARLRQNHRTQPYTGDEHERVIALLMMLAGREEPRLITGVFAALREFGASGYGKLLVDATAGASQRGEFPAFMALLAQMGDVNEPAVQAYLQSVSTGHPDEAIRQIASESLARHKTQ
jgi:hypothetical protein